MKLVNTKRRKFLIAIICQCIMYIIFINNQVCYAINSDNELKYNEDSLQNNSREELIPTTNIEIGNYDKEIEVDKTTNISATLLPADSTDTIEYYSSNTSVATVNSLGEVKGISKGTTSISIKSGNINKIIEIKVKVPTAKIDVNSSYVVLKIGDKFSISAKVYPEEADQNILFTCSNNKVATVSSDGTIIAHCEGSTNVYVKNSDITYAVTVIVNKNSEDNSSKQTDNENIIDTNENNNSENQLQGSELELLKKLESGENITVDSKDYKVITKNVLKKLYADNLTIIINCNGYSIKIEGNNILNYDNELYTDINFDKSDEGIKFEINNGKELPGAISLDLSSKISNGKFLYIYNDSKEKYQMIHMSNVNNISIDESAKYLLSIKKITSGNINIWFIVLVLFVILAGGSAYIVFRKRYWFW